jgi:hypothetical protein
VRNVTNDDLDRQILMTLAVQRVELRIGRAGSLGMTATGIASAASKPLDRVEDRLRALAALGRVVAPARDGEPWVACRGSERPVSLPGCHTRSCRAMASSGST